MMKNPLLFLALLLPALAFSQDREKEFQIRLGYGISAYQTNVIYSYNDGNVTTEFSDEDSAVTQQFPIELRYEITKRINVGLDMRFGKYLYDPDDDNTGKSNSFSSFGLGIEGVIISRPVFRWYAGLTLSRTGLTIKEKGTVYDEKFEWSGGGARYYTGLTWFVADGPVGVNFLLGYDGRKMKLQDFSRDGSSQDLTNIEGELKVGGPEFCAGIVVRFKR